MLFKSLVSAATVALVAAVPLQHQHHEHKRDVKVVTQTTVVIAGADGAVTTAVPKVSLSTASVSVDPTTVVPQGQPSGFSNPSSFETGTASATASSSPQPSGGAGSSGAKGITYTPYSDDGGCKSSSQIASEIKELSGYDIIRLYGVDCDQVSAVLSAKTSSQKIFAGIFDVANIESGISTLASAVKANGGWDHVYTVSVGNELVNGGQASVSQIGEYVSTAKSALKSAGYTGPVVSVDTFIAIINNPGLCEYSDYMAINAHAFFDGHVTAEQAGEWVLLQIQRVADACGSDKSVFVTETGWPSKGDSNGVAVPSKSNQKSAVNSIIDTCGNDVTLFTAFNDLWKADGAYNAEKYWGILSN
ncbi:Cell surface mannoprotein [Meyerozyma sp. JA9]|nr:Cell surface mannoprotein [Meyerozyma sp. JA9]